MPTIQKSCALVTLLITAAAPALGDVTPQEVWQNWQDTSAAMGQTLIAASTARNGDVLTIDNVTIAGVSGGVTIEGNLAQIIMADQGDGTVRVTMSPEYPIKMTLPPRMAGKPEVKLTVLVSQKDLELTASGQPDAIDYDMTAPEVKIKLDRIDGPAGAGANLMIEATLAQFLGTYSSKMVDGVVTAQSDLGAKGMALAVIGSDPAEQTELRATASMTDLTLKSSGALMDLAKAAGLGPDQLAKMQSDTAAKTGTTEFQVEVVNPQGTTTVQGTMEMGNAAATIADGAMRYAAGQQNIALTITAPRLPIADLKIRADDYAFAFNAPIAPSDTALPFGFSTSLTNLVLSEKIWAMFDPSAALPRDPITVVIDTEGTAKMNPLPQGAAAAPMMPAELETLNLKELTFSAAGAELKGAGTSTFDQAAGAMPNPNAKLDFTLTGANALMDRLVASGLIAPQMLTMPRMLLAMVASPAADGSDAYTSTIVIKDKSLSANGQTLYQME